MLFSFQLKAQENPDWYVYSETGKIYKNDKQIADGYSGVGDIAVSGTDWYVISSSGKVYKNDKQITEGYSSFCSISSTKK